MEQLPQLTNREREVADLVRQGMSNKAIASTLTVSERTVEFHLGNIYDKYQVGSRLELVLKLGESTVVDEPEDADNVDGLSQSNWGTSLGEAVSGIGKRFKLERVSISDVRDESSPLTFSEAIRVCLIQYAEFRGRATRPEFWWFALFVVLVTSALTYLSEALGSVFLIAMLLPFLAAGTRRLRDTGQSGWWQLFLLVPVGGLVILGFMWAAPSTSKLADDVLPSDWAQEESK